MQIQYNTHLDITAGNIIPVVKISEHLVLGRVLGSKLAKIAPDPRSFDPSKIKHRPDLQSAAELHSIMQRVFERKKKANVDPYAAFIMDQWAKGEGVTPVMLGFSETKLPIDVDERFGWGFIMIPDDIALVMIDGDTQLAARHAAMNKLKTLGEQFVPFAIYHGKPVEFARKGFRTVNTMGIKVSSSVAIAMDDEDTVTSITNDVANGCEVLRGKVNRSKRQLGSRDVDMLTVSALRQGVACFASGLAGLQYGARPVPVDESKVDELRSNAIAWFDRLTRAFEGQFAMRNAGMITAPAVIAALGVIGRDALGSFTLTAAQRDASFDEKIKLLSGVNWTRGDHWLEAGAKKSAGGKISIGGPKECTHLVYAALSDLQSPGAKLLRGMQKEAA